MGITDREVVIAPDEVTFHPASFADPNGRLFWWRGGLYRGISEEAAPLYWRLFSDGVVRRLVSQGLLIDTEVTPYRIGAFPLVLRHRTVPYVSYAYEWCAQMLRDAAAVVLDLQRELADRGLTLQDAHVWNVVFDGCKPVWVDFGSIVSSPGGRWVARDEFRQFFLNPLHLMALGHGRIARLLLQDPSRGVGDEDIDAFTGSWWGETVARRAVDRLRKRAGDVTPGPIRDVGRRTLRALRGGYQRASGRLTSPTSDAEGLRRSLELIRQPEFDSEWAGYYDDVFPSLFPSPEWTAKHHAINDILSSTRPTSLLDVGCNRGWFAQLGARLGVRVVALDTDEASLTRLYLDCRDKGFPILPLLMDFKNPSPGLGLDNGWLPAATVRLRCDMVLALALVHHLVFAQCLNFEQIVNALKRFSLRWLVVEFITPEDRYVKEWWTPRFSWYTLDNFLAALNQQFRVLKVQPSHPSGRLLVFCETDGAG